MASRAMRTETLGLSSLVMGLIFTDSLQHNKVTFLFLFFFQNDNNNKRRVGPKGRTSLSLSPL